MPRTRYVMSVEVLTMVVIEVNRDIRWIVDAVVDGVRATISSPQPTSPHPIASSPPPFGVIFQDGYTPLHWAAINGYESTVVLLLDRGADKEVKNKVRDEAVVGFDANANFFL